MKVQIRQGIFETNSSSVHSLTLTDECTYNKWKNGDLLYNPDKSAFESVEEGQKFNINLAKQYTDENWMHYSEDMEYQDLIDEAAVEGYLGEMYLTYDEWCDRYIDSQFETFCKTDCINGIAVCGFGYYGVD